MVDVEIPEKRYYRITELAYFLDVDQTLVRAIIKSFRIRMAKSDGVQVIDSKNLGFFMKAYEFKKESGIKYSYLETLPKRIIKLLVKKEW